MRKEDVGKKQGMVIGNLPNGKPIVMNEDGSVSTVFSRVATDPRINAGKPSVMPSLFGGLFRSDAEATDIVARNAGFDPDTKEAIPAFNSIDEAILASKDMSRRHGEVIRQMQVRKLLNLLGIKEGTFGDGQ